MRRLFTGLLCGLLVVALLSLAYRAAGVPGNPGDSSRKTTWLLNEKLTDLELQELKLEQDFGPDHPKVQGIREQIERTRKALIAARKADGDAPLSIRPDEIPEMNGTELRKAVAILLSEVIHLRVRVAQLEESQKPRTLLVEPGESRRR